MDQADSGRNTMLDRPYQRIANGLRQVLGTDPVIEASVKVGDTAGIGMTDQKKHRARTAGEPDPARAGHGPDVRAQIIATHRANSYRP